MTPPAQRLRRSPSNAAALNRTHLTVDYQSIAGVRLVLFFRSCEACVASRVPARRPGNFGARITSLREVSGPPLREHLQGQMKVTKAKALNTTPVLTFCALRHRAQRATWKLRDRSHPQFARRVLAARRPWVQRKWARSGSLDQRGRGFARPAPPSGLQPGFAAGSPSGPLGAGPAREERTERCCIEPLCFGDFHLGPQMFAKRGSAHFAQRSYAGTKVTRPPGRDPAGNAGLARAEKTRQAERSRWAAMRPRSHAIERDSASRGRPSGLAEPEPRRRLRTAPAAFCAQGR